MIDRIEKINPQPGDVVLVISDPPEVDEGISDWAKERGVEVWFVPRGVEIQTLSEEQMWDLGWVRA